MLSPYVYLGIEQVCRSMFVSGLKAKDPKRIIKTVSNVTGISISDMKSKSRKREFTEARHICMGIIREVNKSISLSSIGFMFGKRDHSTVIYAEKTYKDLLDTNKKFSKLVETIKSKL